MAGETARGGCPRGGGPWGVRLRGGGPAPPGRRSHRWGRAARRGRRGDAGSRVRRQRRRPRGCPRQSASATRGRSGSAPRRSGPASGRWESASGRSATPARLGRRMRCSACPPSPERRPPVGGRHRRFRQQAPHPDAAATPTSAALPGPDASRLRRAATVTASTCGASSGPSWRWGMPNRCQPVADQ